MEVTLTIPDGVASEIQNGNAMPLSRRVLELAAVKAYEANIIDEWEVIEMLGFDGQEELYTFFKQYDVRNSIYSTENFEKAQAFFATKRQDNLPVQEFAGLEAQVQAQGHKFYGIFADDPGALEVFDEIERLRDQELLANPTATAQA